MAHLDLYRLESLAGEDPALLDDYLTPERVGFVEWPAAAEPAIDRVAARVRLEHAGRAIAAGSWYRVNMLGIDTSTAASAACVLRGDGEAFEVEPPAGGCSRPPGALAGS